MGEKKVKEAKMKANRFIYVGETNRSLFERGWEHLQDFTNLSVKSRMLKHAVEIHQGEDPLAVQFGMKVVRYMNSAWDRQILESCEIQGNRGHHILNSRSEFNRCALPRMMCKLGDKTFKKNEEEIETDLAKEEEKV